MRTFEVLTLFASFMTLIAVLLPDRKGAFAVRAFAPVAGALFVVLHLIFEGYRWQMAPLYGLTLVLLILGLVRRARQVAPDAPPPSKGRRIAVGIVVVLGIVLVVAEAALLYVFPVVRLPKPTGPYGVGTSFLEFVDSKRPETLTEDPSDVREFSGRLWYPAVVPPGAKPMAYAQPKPAIGTDGGPPAFLFSHLALSESNASLDAPMSADRKAFPVLVFSPGFHATFEDYQMIVEELASQGYVVISLTHPLESEPIVRSDGTVVRARPEHRQGFQEHMKVVYPMWERFWGSEDPEERYAIAKEMLVSESFMDNILRIRVADIRFAVDELGEMNAGSLESALAGRLDLSRLGIVGHSMGGAVAGQTCLVDDRFKAGINLDGFQFGDVVDGVIGQPFMTIYGEPFARVNDFVMDRFERTSYILTIKGTTHSNFQDIGIVLPLTQRMGMVGTIPPERAIQLTNEYISNFFAMHLLGEAAPLLEADSPVPEIEIEVHEADDAAPEESE